MKSRPLVLLLVPLLLWSALVLADEARWEQYLRGGEAAYQRGDYEKAVGQTKAALKEAEDFGEQDPRFAVTLSNLAEIYRAQGRYAEGEPLYQRALVIDKKALGPEHPGVATDLNNLALLYQAQGRYDEAEPLHQQALAIAEEAAGARASRRSHEPQQPGGTLSSPGPLHRGRNAPQTLPGD